MPRFAANLSMLYPELDFLDRFEAAARDGFEAVEFLFPYEHAAADIAARLSANGLRQVLFNAPSGDFAGGERGLACLPGRQQAFIDGVARALEYADALECPRIHVMAGLVPSGLSATDVRPVYVDNLRRAAALAAEAGRKLTIEPINTRDMPGYLLNRQDEAHAIVEEVGSSVLQVQFDLYHCQIVEGDVATKLRRYLPTGRVGHLQIAGVPMRHEPDMGELDYRYLLGVIDELSAQTGWDGWIGCEYRPSRGAVPGGTSAGLGWLRGMR